MQKESSLFFLFPSEYGVDVHVIYMKHAYMFSLFAGSSLLLTIGVYDSLDSPN